MDLLAKREQTKNNVRWYKILKKKTEFGGSYELSSLHYHKHKLASINNRTKKKVELIFCRINGLFLIGEVLLGLSHIGRVGDWKILWMAMKLFAPQSP